MGSKKAADFLKRLGVKSGQIKEKLKRGRNYDVVDEHENTHPTTETKCNKCGNGQAYWWTKQTRASDEPETKFMKCTSCGHTWRDAS